MGAVNIWKKWQSEAREKIEDIKEKIVKSAKEIYPESTVILYGAYALGLAGDESEVKICVLVDRIIGHEDDEDDNRFAMEYKIEKVFRQMYGGSPFPMDIIIYTYDEYENVIHHSDKIKQDGIKISSL